MANSTLMMGNESLTEKLGNNHDSNLETIVIVNIALIGPLMLISIIGNALLLAAVLRTPSLRSPSTVFLCNLAVSDLLVGLVVQPVSIADALKPSSLSLAISEDALTFFICGVSLCTMAVISVDRLMALQYHMRYSHMMTTKRPMYTSATLWIMSLLLSCLSLWNLNTYVLTMAALIAFCLFISKISYMGIYRIVRQHQIQIQVQQQAMQNLNGEHSLNMTTSRRSAVNTFIFYICMVVCYSPALISSFIKISLIHFCTAGVCTSFEWQLPKHYKIYYVNKERKTYLTI